MGWLPVIIDMPRSLAFIKLHPSLFVLHRLQKKLGLLLAHLAFLLRFGLRRSCAVCALWSGFSSPAPFTSPANFFRGDESGVGVGVSFAPAPSPVPGDGDGDGEGMSLPPSLGLGIGDCSCPWLLGGILALRGSGDGEGRRLLFRLLLARGGGWSFAGLRLLILCSIFPAHSWPATGPVRLLRSALLLRFAFDFCWSVLLLLLLLFLLIFFLLLVLLLLVLLVLLLFC